MKIIQNILVIVFVLIQLTSCNSNKHDNIESKILTKVDTLDYHEKIYLDKKGFGQPNMIFKHKTKTKKGLHKNEEIIMTLVYEGDLQDLVKHTVTDIIPESDKLKIEKIDNYHFKLFINPDYSEKIISMIYYLTPKKNYVMKVYFQDEIVNHPNRTIGTIMNKIVEQN